ncbi:MAG: mucoidy inhibitor MuiA family protein [Lewinella sp.]|nr:mucoidy inhibitor MuiA family protein [Lewinella sp.]
MKIITMTMLALLWCSIAWANTADTFIPTEVRSVTVYRSGAQVYRSGSGQVPAGQSIIKFTDLSPAVTPSSIQFSATGDFTILSVNFQRNYINPLENSVEAKALQSQIEGLDEQLRRLDVEMQVLKEEESLLLANKQIGGQQTGVQLQDLQAIAEYYRNRLKAIKLESLDLEQDKQQMLKEKEKLQQQLGEITGRMKRGISGEIWVKVLSERAVDARFQLNYLVPTAGWTPSYDVRVADIGEAVDLDLKGDVYQSSGENWEGVTLSLSTGVPTEGGVKPNVQPWWLAPYEPVVYYDARDQMAGKAAGMGIAKEEAESRDYASPPPPPPPPPPPAEYASVEQFERTTTREYRISVPYDIPSDGKPYTVAIEKYELPATYQYYVAPKYDQDAFLTAKVSGWEEYNLLSGPANLFFEGSFLGKTQLNTRQTSDTLELSLGRDKGIVVTRVKDDQYKDKQFIGSKETRRIGWKIELRNTKSKAVNILVEDQIPISTSDEIEVTLRNDGGARLEKERGRLTWELDLKPGASRTLNFQYEVKYPKRMELVLE